MRINSTVIEIARMPIRDDILPLTKPIVGTSGKVYTELPVPEGTVVYVSMTGYNLYVHSPPPLQSAHITVSRQESGFMGSRCLCVPARALVRNGRASGIACRGVWESVRPRAVFRRSCRVLTSHPPSATFSGGVKGCLGWRFACVDQLLHWNLTLQGR